MKEIRNPEFDPDFCPKSVGATPTCPISYLVDNVVQVVCSGCSPVW